MKLKNSIFTKIVLMVCIIACGAICQTSVAYANEKSLTVSGVVNNSNGEVLPFVNIVEEGTLNGVITDLEGRFSLAVDSDQSILLISYIGYASKRIEVGSQTQFVINLEKDELMLDDIVVTGQGIGQSKKRLTSKAEVISEDVLERSSSKRIDQLLQSEIPSLQINLSGGQPGSSSTIRSRGVSSGFSSTTPIIYVDGVRMDNLNSPASLGAISGSSSAANSSIANIPMENIERVEFVNGGAATTLYGADAANGVIQIFTKKGSNRAMNVYAKGETGFENATDDFYTFDETAEFLHQTGFVQRYSTGAQGGTDQVTFSFSAGMNHSTGTRIHDKNENKSYYLSNGITAKLFEKIKYTGSFNYNESHYQRARNGNLGGYTGLWILEGGAGAPIFGLNNRLNELSSEEYTEIKSFVSEAERLQDRTAINRRFQTSHALNYAPIDDLNLKLLVGVDNYTQVESDIISNEYLQATQSSSESSITNSRRNYLGLTLEAILAYNVKIGELSMNNQMGFQGFRNDEEQVLYQGVNIANGATSIENAATTTSDQRIIELANYGLFFNTNISYFNKYIVELGLRGDKSDTFGEQIGMQYYPRLGLSYVISEEAFMQDVSFINGFKLRANYGEAGNLPPAFAHERTIEFDGYNGEIAIGFGQPGNSELSPERIKSFEIGTELSAFDHRLKIGFDYYNSRTTDALMYAPQTPSSGSSSDAIQNVGEISNSGIELSLQGDVVRTNNVQLSLTASLNTLNNKVEDLNGLAPFSINGFSERTIQVVVMENQSVGVLRGNKAIFNTDGVVTGYEPLSVLGKTTPDLYGSFGLSLDVKNFNLFVNADYQKGAYAHSFDRQFRYYYQASEEGIPQAEIDANQRSNWLSMTDQFVEKTDYIKVRTIAASYRHAFNSSSALKEIIFGLNVSNPFNFASSSFDPEVSQAGSNLGQGSVSTGGIAYSIESSPRQYLFSVNFKF